VSEIGEAIVEEYEQEWVSASQLEQIAKLCTAAAKTGWTVRAVSFGRRYWLPPGNGPERMQEGWLVLFWRRRSS
jgi:hypothetical protein